MEEVEIITLENGANYQVVDTIERDDVNYLYLININDSKDIALVKETYDNGECHLENLDSEDEFNEIMIEIVRKNSDKIKEILDLNE